MKGSIREVDAQRSRWRAHRRHLDLIEGLGEGFALGGLAQFAEELAARLLVLPSDPDGDAVPLNEETLDWLKEERPSPYGGSPVRWGLHARATSNALVVYDQRREDRGWDRYLALHRSGGIEFGSGRHTTYAVGEARAFALRETVGLVWSALAIHSEAVDRWPIPLPIEVTFALVGTKNAILGSFAEGWREPGLGLSEAKMCLEDHILLRREFDEHLAVDEVAVELGDRIEQSFGTTHRRHLAYKGEYMGKFDPRFRT